MRLNVAQQQVKTVLSEQVSMTSLMSIDEKAKRHFVSLFFTFCLFCGIVLAFSAKETFLCIRGKKVVRVARSHTHSETTKRMARGLSRDLAREKNAKKSGAGSAKGNKESLTPQQRAKEAQKAKDLASGKLTPEQVKEEEARKAKMREKQKMSQFASNNPLLAKNLAKK
jgi:hypothetical protein